MADQPRTTREVITGQKAGLPGRRAARKSYEQAKATKPLGEGSRFKALKASAKASGARSPGAVAYTAGVKAHGKATMTRLAQAGKARARGK